MRTPNVGTSSQNNSTRGLLKLAEGSLDPTARIIRRSCVSTTLLVRTAPTGLVAMLGPYPIAAFANLALATTGYLLSNGFVVIVTQ